MEALNKQPSVLNQTDTLEESQIIALCKTFDNEAQRMVYEKYATPMLHTCRRYVQDEMEAEDLMIVGFVKVFSKIGTFNYRGKGSFFSWIKRIMTNECLMLLRKKKYDKVDLSQVYNLSSDMQNAEAMLTEELIVEQIKKLAKGYRTVFNLYVIEGYSHKEIGKKLGISENTSKSQLSKARASLSKTLTKLDIL